MSLSKNEKKLEQDSINEYIARTAPPVPIEAVARNLGIDVKYKDLGAISGKIEKDKDGKGYTITVNSKDNGQQRRFTIAHEIAHYMLHRTELDGNKMHRIIEDDESYQSRLNLTREMEANRYAAELLMPASIMQKVVKEYNKRHKTITIKDLAEIFDVSYTAMRMRIGIPV